MGMHDTTDKNLWTLTVKQNKAIVYQKYILTYLEFDWNFCLNINILNFVIRAKSYNWKDII